MTAFRSDHFLPNHTPRVVTALLSAIVTQTWLTMPADAFHLGSRELPRQWWAHTDQPPPPMPSESAWNRFLQLQASYQVVGSKLGISFLEWLQLHGVNGGAELRHMLHWFEHGSH